MTNNQKPCFLCERYIDTKEVSVVRYGPLYEMGNSLEAFQSPWRVFICPSHLEKISQEYATAPGAYIRLADEVTA